MKAPLLAVLSFLCIGSCAAANVEYVIELQRPCEQPLSLLPVTTGDCDDRLWVFVRSDNSAVMTFIVDVTYIALDGTSKSIILVIDRQANHPWTVVVQQLPGKNIIQKRRVRAMSLVSELVSSE